MPLPAIPLLLQGLGTAASLYGMYKHGKNRPEEMDYNFNYKVDQPTAQTSNYRPNADFLSSAKGLQNIGMDFISGDSKMQKGLLDEAYKTSFDLADNQYNQVLSKMAQGGIGAGGMGGAFRSITRSGAGENYRKSALGIGNQFAGLGLNALQSASSAFGAIDSNVLRNNMFNTGQVNQANQFNATNVNNMRQYSTGMGYEQAVGNQNALAAHNQAGVNNWMNLGGGLMNMGMGMSNPSAGMNQPSAFTPSGSENYTASRWGDTTMPSFASGFGQNDNYNPMGFRSTAGFGPTGTPLMFDPQTGNKIASTIEDF